MFEIIRKAQNWIKIIEKEGLRDILFIIVIKHDQVSVKLSYEKGTQYITIDNTTEDFPTKEKINDMMNDVIDRR